MGVVYEAEQVSLGRHVALKLLPRNLLPDARAKRRFEREAKSAAVLGISEGSFKTRHLRALVRLRALLEVEPE